VRLNQDEITALSHRYGLKFLVYFGSFLTEHYRKDSDIDLAFLAHRPLSSTEKWELCKELMILHRKSEIDLVDLQTAEPLLRYIVATEGRLLYEEEVGTFERYALFYVKHYYELAPVIQDQMRRLMVEIKELDSDDNKSDNLQ